MRVSEVLHDISMGTAFGWSFEPSFILYQRRARNPVPRIKGLTSKTNEKSLTTERDTVAHLINPKSIYSASRARARAIQCVAT
jgi:hypothetical protein